MRRHSGTAVVLVLALSALTGRASPDSFDPFAGEAARYHFDLGKNFFTTAEAERKARGSLEAQAKRLDSVAVGAAHSFRQLLEGFQLGDTVMRDLSKHQAYLSLRYYVDVRDTEALSAANEVGVEIGSHLERFDATLAQLSPAKLEQLLREEPKLSRYRFAIELSRRAAAHRPRPSGSETLPAPERVSAGWGPALLSSTLAGLDFGKVHTPEGDLDVRKQYGLISASPDRQVRQRGYELNRDALLSRRDTFASILTRTAEARHANARRRIYRDYIEQSYAERFLNQKDVNRLFEVLARTSAINKRYEEIRIEHLQCVFGYKDVHTWDLSVSDPAQNPPRLTVQQASDALLRAAAPLESEYLKQLATLLDPANGRMEIAPAPHKAERQGFSTGLVGYPSMFFQGAYTGFLDDIIVFAHESSHAVQNMMMDQRGVLPRYAAGPSYFTESFGLFGELLLLRSLLQSSTTSQARIFYLEKLLDQATNLFRNAWESELEQRLYEDVVIGKAPGADDIEGLTQQIASRYSVWHGANSERRTAWITPTQFYTRPLYRLNYVYAELLALHYIQALRRSPREFAARYTTLLGHGYDEQPTRLLEDRLGTPLSDARLVQDAVELIGAWNSDLEKLYKENSVCKAPLGQGQPGDLNIR